MAETSFSRPTMATLVARQRTDLLSRLDLSDVRRDDAEVFARVQAEGLNGLYAYLDWQAEQYLPDLAAQGGLERWARLLGLWYAPASAATGELTVTGVVGSQIDIDAQWQTASGVIYRPVDAVTLTAATQAVAVIAAAAGAAGNLAAGGVLALISPIAGIQSQAVVAAAGLSGGADQEGVESLRARVLQRLRQPPRGGSKSDYENWALAAHASVTRAWVYRNELGPGTVTVRLVCDRLDDPIPTAAVLEAVAGYIEQVRPVTAEVYVVAPVAVPVGFTLSVTPDTPAVRAGVVGSLADLLRRESEPGGTLLLSHIKEAISQVAGETDHVLTAPIADVVLGAGEFAVMGAITWQ
ncbi:baseplate J/gp47 family protein [Stutzerimonas stutzeri]|nr:baseplate J/gp47 family protein [Stutzerimonas stutzeri]